MKCECQLFKSINKHFSRTAQAQCSVSSRGNWNRSNHFAAMQTISPIPASTQNDALMSLCSLVEQQQKQNVDQVEHYTSLFVNDYIRISTRNKKPFDRKGTIYNSLDTSTDSVIENEVVDYVRSIEADKWKRKKENTIEWICTSCPVTKFH